MKTDRFKIIEIFLFHMTLPSGIKNRLQKHFLDYSLSNQYMSVFGVSDDLNIYTQKLCGFLGIEREKRTVSSFACGESHVCLNSSVRNKKAYLIIPVLPDTNSRLIETFFFIDALKSAEISEINLIFPCLPYARQDRRNDKREHIGTRVLANCIEGIKGTTKTRIITLDMHSEQSEAAFRDADIEPLRLNSLYSYFIKKLFGVKNLTLMSPDFGGVKRLEKFKFIEEPVCDVRVAFVHKKRIGHNKSVVCDVVGEIKDRDVVIIDDIFDTGGSMIKACRAAKNLGAKTVNVLVTHAYFSKDAISELSKAQKEKIIDKFIFTDTIRLSDENYKKIVQFNVDAYIIPTTLLIADVIARIQLGKSLSPLYHEGTYIEELYSDVEPKKVV